MAYVKLGLSDGDKFKAEHVEHLEEALAKCLTEDDKTDLVNEVLAALPTWTGGSY